ncbi:alginate O-acetyltransferase AlgX-related protein [Clostridium akagii]|uniref:alginate O-acetyltransferase AlgX-related protein n=1 Tax=Clostridium akagii TaxID=91623 RepID=UPI0005692D7E|nr:membrane protein [Clostridium akagii]
MNRTGKRNIKKYFFKKTITSIIFIIFIIGFSIGNFIYAYNPLVACLAKEKASSDSLKDTIAALEATIEDSVLDKYTFVETYGYVQRLLCKNEESNFEVVKDKTGILHYTYFAEAANPVYTIAKRTEAFKKNLKDKNTKFDYVMPPDKDMVGYTKFSTGLPNNYVNETTDAFLGLLKQNNVDTIDLRKNLDKSGIDPDKMFYRTDHHWQTQTVFWEFGQLVNDFKTKYGLNLDPDGFYTNKNNYNSITYKNSYLGSMGRKTGISYAGVDDYTIMYPKFATSYNYYSKTGSQVFDMNGRFENVLLTVSPFTTDKGTYSLEGDKYDTYLLGNQGITHITNKNNPNGPKMLFVKDSLTVPLAAFLSTVCSDVYLVDPRYYPEDIPKYVNSLNLDYVFISYSPQDLTPDFFRFYQDK